jgi:hypothetical protein
VIEILAAAVGGSAAAIAAGAAGLRWWQRRRELAEQREHDRFSHYVYPETDELRIGTTHEPAGMPPDHEPLVTVDTAFTVRIAPDRRLHIPAGARLQVRAFTGAVRRILDHVTTAHGTVARVSFDVPRGVSFWILDAPAWAQLREAADGGRGLRGLGPWEITTRLRPIPGGNAVTHVTMHELSGPPWLFGLDGADEWLAPRIADAPEVVLLDLSDPSAPPGYVPRDDQVAGTMPALAAALWLRTGVRTRFVVPYVPGRGRLVTRKRAPWHPDELAELQKGGAALIHGAAEPDLDDTGATVTVRIGGALQGPALTAPLGRLIDDVAAELAARGIAQPCARDASMAMPRDLDGHARVLADLVRITMMTPQVRAVPRRPIGGAAVSAAARLAAAEPGCIPAKLTWISTALAAHAIDDLPTADRDAVLAAVAAATSADDPLYLLAPRVLHGLGQLDAATAAREARKTLGTGAYRDPDGYAKWLDRVD